MKVAMTDVQIIVLCAAGAQILFESYLRNANERRLLDMKDNPPASASGLMDEQTWGKATDYSIAKSRFSTVEDIFGFFLFIGIILYLFPWAFSQWPPSG